MRLSYDPAHNIAYLGFHEKTGHVTTLRLTDDLNVDIARDGTVCGIELLNANRQLWGDQGRLVVESAGRQKEVALAPRGMDSSLPAWRLYGSMFP